MIDERLFKLVEDVQSNPKYQSISGDFVRQLAEDTLRRGLSGKSAVKDVRNKLHQVGGAYLRQNIKYGKVKEELNNLPPDLHSDQVKSFCVDMMRSHTSTAERLPIIETFFKACLEPIGPVRSVLDLACGMNPFAVPWMPLVNEFSYHACDIYLDMLGLIGYFFEHFGVDGSANACDLINYLPKTNAQVTFLLKSIPCLEQVDKTIGSRLLDAIQSQYILVSFPVRSLGGQKKGMLEYYRCHFFDLVADRNWDIREFIFSTELAFLVTK